MIENRLEFPFKVVWHLNVNVMKLVQFLICLYRWRLQNRYIVILVNCFKMYYTILKINLPIQNLHDVKFQWLIIDSCDRMYECSLT